MRRQIATQAALLLIGLFVLLPVWGLVYLAFDGGVKGWPTQFRIWPEQFTLRIFEQMWLRPAQTETFLSLLKNSLLVSGGAALFACVSGASMAYAFARLRFAGRRAGLLALLVGAMLPPVALMAPLYILLEALHLRTTLAGLALVYASFSLPFCIWNMRAAFQSAPPELEEAAFLDGAGRLAAFWHVSLPLALPSIAVAALIAFLTGYSEFAMGWLFVQKPQNVTLAMAVSGMVQGSLASWSNLAALAVMMSAPAVLVFLLVQRLLLNRLLIGQAE